MRTKAKAKGPSNTDLYRKNGSRISVLQQFSTGRHVFVNDQHLNMFPTDAQYYKVAAECGLDMREPGFYAVLNTFFDLGKDSKNNYTVNFVARLPDERIAKDLSMKLYRSEVNRYEDGPTNLEDPGFIQCCELLFNDPEVKDSA